jgi:hypothetical protein
MTTINYRARLVSIDEFWKDNANLIDYVEVRAATDIMSTHGLSQSEVESMFQRGERIAMDCSEAFTTACRWAGLPDPNGPTFNYNGYGNTTTLYAFLTHIAITTGLAGDGVMFPAPPGVAHITQIITPNGTNPTVFSNGDEAGPYIYPLSDDAVSHPGQSEVCLSIARLLPPVPRPPADPNHYLWFDDTVRTAPHGNTSERECVKNYDAHRTDVTKWRVELLEEEENLDWFATRLEGVMRKYDPKGVLYHRAWRRPQLNDRAAGEQVVK